MAGYTKVQSDNKHLQNMGSAQFVHLDGSTASNPVVPSTDSCSLLRVILNTNGNAATIRSGSRVIGVIANDAPEGTFHYGVWCPDGITVDCAGAVSLTIVFDNKEE
jgi:hypothetical protein